MEDIQIRFPKVCAWCGTLPPSATREVNVRTNARAGQQYFSLKFNAPICKTCDAYVNALFKAFRIRLGVIFIGSFIVVLLLGLLGGGMEEDGFFVCWFGGGLVLGLILWMITSLLKKLDKWLDFRMVGKPPEGYAAPHGDPCEMRGYRNLLFYNDTFQKLFAALNPGLVRQ